MDDLPIFGSGRDQRVAELMAHYGAPAFARRAAQVQEAYEQVLRLCRQQREEWLGLVRTRLATLGALAGDWAALEPLLADARQVGVLRDLAAALEPRLRAPVKPTSSARTLTRALVELRASTERFNRRWLDFVPTVDLTRVNALREGYNRYYLLEKECAVRSARVAHQGFRRLEPLTHADLLAVLPPLPVVPVTAG